MKNKHVRVLFMCFTLVFCITIAQQAVVSGQENSLDAIIPDFQVNENSGASGAVQTYSSVSSNGSGKFVITWLDRRNGETDLYAQLYDIDGSEIGSNFKVNEGRVNADQYFPSIAMDDSGSFVIAWIGAHNNGSVIYAQRYASDGSATGANFKVNDHQDKENQYSYGQTISMDNTGNFIIAWEDERSGYGEHIYAQRYTKEGSTIGNNFKVGDENGWGTSVSSVSMDANGYFIIAWINNIGSNIYAQRYSNEGDAIDSIFIVNDAALTRRQDPTISVSISIDNNGNFMITWEGNDNKIYARYYSNDGNPKGPNFIVNDSDERCDSPSVFTDGNDEFVVTWIDRRDGHKTVYAQRYKNNGAASWNNFRITDNQSDASLHRPSVSKYSDRDFMITWTDERDGETNGDIYAQHYSGWANKAGYKYKVNDDVGSTSQHNSSISVDDDGNFVIAWEDHRNISYSNRSRPDIYAQRYASNGSMLGSNFKVNNHYAGGRDPSVAADRSGDFVIVWSDSRNFTINDEWNTDIYAQRYTSDGNAIGSNFKVNDHPAGGSAPSISTDSSGNFVITWADLRNAPRGESWPRDIYTQRYTGNGTTIGSNFKVNDHSDGARNPSISINSSGDMVIAWEDNRGEDGIYAQRYAANGDAISAIGSNFNVNHGWDGVQYPSVSIDVSGAFTVVWEDYRNAGVYAKRYDNDGHGLGNDFRVNENSAGSQGTPSISTDSEGKCLIVWGDSDDIYAQRYASDGST
jgi:hypothetical protein